MKNSIKLNFLFIGPCKSGSKWLHKVFMKHPNIFVPPIADIYYFDRDDNYRRGEDWYNQYFKNVNEGHIAIGELSHDYINSKKAPMRIKNYNKNMKLIINLRDPIDRSFSEYIAEYNAGWINCDYSDAVKQYPHLIDNSMYYEKIKHYLNYFDKENILILKFDDLVNNKSDFMEKIFSFIHVRYIKELEYIPPYNTASKPRIQFLGVFVKKIAEQLRSYGMLNQLAFYKRNKFIRQIVFKENKKKVDKNLKNKLLKLFYEDIKNTEKITGINLESWYS
jgi:hypothetical protein